MTQMQRHAWLLACTFLLCLCGNPAVHAQPDAALPAPPAQPEAPLPPWYAGVSAERKETAERLFTEALALHEQLLRSQAVVKYEEALAQWENPIIRWNLALVFNDMGEYLRAYENIDKALTWKRKAFEPEDQKQMLALRETLLREHLAIIESRCFTPGTDISLDGKPWFRSPKIERKVIVPGEHVITAKKPGYFPVVKSVTLLAGRQGMVMLPMDVDGIVEKRRWARWKPWAVLGAGAALGIVGAGLQVQASVHFDEAEDVAARCAPQCPPSSEPTPYERAVAERWMGVASFIAGGGLASLGLALLYMNRPQAYRTQPKSEPIFKLLPLVSRDAASLSGQMRF